MVPHKIIVAGDQKNVHGFSVVRIFQLKGIEYFLKCCAWDRNIVSVNGVSLVLSGGGGGWGKKVVESGI